MENLVDKASNNVRISNDKVDRSGFEEQNNSENKNDGKMDEAESVAVSSGLEDEQENLAEKLTINLTSPNTQQQTNAINILSEGLSTYDASSTNTQEFAPCAVKSSALLSIATYGSDSDETVDCDSEEIRRIDREKSVALQGAQIEEEATSTNRKEGCNYVIFSETSSDSDGSTSGNNECKNGDVIMNNACYRDNQDSSSDSDEETTSYEESSGIGEGEEDDEEDEEEEEEEQEVEEDENEETVEDDDNEGEQLENDANLSQASNTKQTAKGKPVDFPCVQRDFIFENLPPVPDLSQLKIDVKEDDCIQMGNIGSVVDKIVVVQSLPEMPAYDVDTLLFLDMGRRPLGHVYDIIGPVSSPIYAIRFNTKEEIEKLDIKLNDAVYSAPKTLHTRYVFVKELLRVKGSDASWSGDNEVPPEFVDFSDDEQEFDEDSSAKIINRKRNSSERHRVFEIEMNRLNNLNTAYHKMKDGDEPKNKLKNNRTYNPFVAANNNGYCNMNFGRTVSIGIGGATQQLPRPAATFGVLPQTHWPFVTPTIPPSSTFGMQPLLCSPYAAYPPFSPVNVPPPPLAVPPPPIAAANKMPHVAPSQQQQPQTFNLMPIFRPFAAACVPPPPPPQPLVPSGGCYAASSAPKAQVCPMPYPPCLGLPPPSAPATPPNGPQYSGNFAASARGVAKPYGAPNKSNNNGCGYYRKQF